MRRLLIFAAMAGVSVPGVFLLLWSGLERWRRPVDSLEDSVLILQQMVWPSSVMMMVASNPDDSRLYWSALALSVASNVALYVILASVLWLGVARGNRAYYVAVAAALLALWWLVLWALR
jgi:hypothetical protein